MVCKSFFCGVVVGMAAALTALPMADPVIRGRMLRCGKRMVRKARCEIENLM